MSHPTPWATPDIDARIVALREVKVSLLGMSRALLAEFGVTVSRDQLLRRTRTLGLPVLATVFARREMSALPLPAAGAWGTPECEATFRAAWIAGASHMDMAKRFHVSKVTIWRHGARLGLVPTDNRTKAQGGYTPVRGVSGRQGSALMFRGLTTLPTGAVEHVAGRCRWPLTCESECSGRYCDEHRSLIRRAA